MDDNTKRRRGRPRGSKNKLPSWRERFDQVLTALDGEGALLRLVQAVLKAAEGGDMQAAGILLRHWIPEPPKSFAVKQESQAITEIKLGFSLSPDRPQDGQQAQGMTFSFDPLPESALPPLPPQPASAPQLSPERLAEVEALEAGPTLATLEPEEQQQLTPQPPAKPGVVAVTARRDRTAAEPRTIAYRDDIEIVQPAESERARYERIWNSPSAWR